MMSRTLAHSRHLARQALQRHIDQGIVVLTRTMDALIADHTPDPPGFFAAHDNSGQTYVLSLSDLILSPA